MNLKELERDILLAKLISALMEESVKERMKILDCEDDEEKDMYKFTYKLKVISMISCICSDDIIEESFKSTLDCMTEIAKKDGRKPSIFALFNVNICYLTYVNTIDKLEDIESGLSRIARNLFNDIFEGKTESIFDDEGSRYVVSLIYDSYNKIIENEEIWKQ